MEKVVLLDVDNMHCDVSEQTIACDIMQAHHVNLDAFRNAVFRKVAAEHPEDALADCRALKITGVEVDAAAAWVGHKLRASTVAIDGDGEPACVSARQQVKTISLTVHKDSHCQAYTHQFSCPGVRLTSDTVCTTHYNEELDNDGLADIQSIDVTVEFEVEWLNVLGAPLRLAPGQYALKSWHGTWLRGCPDGHVELSPHRRDWEVWTVRNAGAGKVSVTSVHGSEMWCSGEEPIVRLRKGYGAGTQLRMKAALRGRVALISPEGLMLQGYPGGNGAWVALNACEEEWATMTWEQWRLVPV